MGKIDLLQVLIVQKAWIAAKIHLLHISTSRLINRVNLHLALGGSFESGSSKSNQSEKG